MATQLKDRQIKILIADHETLLTGKLATFLREKGFAVKHVQTGSQASLVIKEWAPQLVYCDLMLPEKNALTLLKELKAQGQLAEDKTRVFVTSGQNIQSNIRESLKLGASDFLVKPIKHEDLFMRLVLHLQTKRVVRSIEQDSSQHFMHQTDLLLKETLKGGETLELLHSLTHLLATSVSAVRVSMIRCNLMERIGNVIASSDNKSIGGLKIDLMKYPEVIYVLTKDKILALDNLSTDPTMHFVTKKDKEINFNSMIVVPVHYPLPGDRPSSEMGHEKETPWGVVSIRLPSTKERLTDLEIRYAQLATHVMNLVIKQDANLSQRTE